MVLCTGLATVLVLAGCSSGAGSSAPATTRSATPTTATAAAIAGVSRAPSPFERFEQVRATIASVRGRHTPCMLLARTDATRAEGLMHVAEAGLGGYAGMIFAFDADVTGTFTMADTLIPLTIVFLDATGHVVSSRVMTPCPRGQAKCPTYPASGPYRTAIEVPAGHAPALGLDDGAKVVVGGACTA
jgi:uncharacterized membrane protein (UPF0127 family)